MLDHSSPRTGATLALLATVALVTALFSMVACDPGPAGVLEPDSALASHASAAWSPWSEPVPIEAVNTPVSEMAPSLSRDGLSLYFQSNRSEPLGLDAPLTVNRIWVSRRACLACPFQTPVPLGEDVNAPGFNANGPVQSRDGHWLFFHSNRRDPGWQGAGDIWASYRERIHDDLAWGPPVNLGPGVNTATAETQAGYFENAGGAAQLFFSRNVAGAAAIHMSFMQPDGTWGEAVPVTELNSDALDARPSVHPNGLEIYFFSHRDDHRLWHATRPSVDSPWSPPVRLDQFTPGEASVFQPSIHALGRTETLLMGGFTQARGQEIYMSTRTRGVGAP